MKCSFEGRINTEENANSNSDKKSDNNDLPANKWREGSKCGDSQREDISKNKPKNTTKEGKNEGFEKKLRKDIGTRGTNGFTNTDFMGTLGD